MRSIDNRRDEQSPDLQRWYSGYLRIGTLPIEVMRRVDHLAQESGVLDATPTAVEVEYKGRDSSHQVVRTLLLLAQLIRNADGEVRCEVSGDTDQLWFEFYRIRDGHLYRQLAEVVRRPQEVVNQNSV